MPSWSKRITCTTASALVIGGSFASSDHTGASVRSIVFVRHVEPSTCTLANGSERPLLSREISPSASITRIRRRAPPPRPRLSFSSGPSNMLSPSPSRRRARAPAVSSSGAPPSGIASLRTRDADSRTSETRMISRSSPDTVSPDRDAGCSSLYHASSDSPRSRGISASGSTSSPMNSSFTIRLRSNMTRCTTESAPVSSRFLISFQFGLRVDSLHDVTCARVPSV